LLQKTGLNGDRNEYLIIEVALDGWWCAGSSYGRIITGSDKISREEANLWVDA
jgi:hypothetical protein